MTEDIQRRFEGEIRGDWFVIAIRLGERAPHAWIYMKTEEEVKETLAELAEGE